MSRQSLARRVVLLCTWLLLLAIGFASGPADAAHTTAGSSPRADDSNAAVHGSYRGVVALAADDVWAVGYRRHTRGFTPMAVAFDGRRWVDRSPDGPTGGSFAAVSGTSAHDVWAAGSRGTARPFPLVDHWNGSRWSAVTLPKLPTNLWSADVTSIHAVSPTLVWAVGVASTRDGQTRAFILRASDGHWGYVTTPNPPRSARELFGVDAGTPATGWAVGDSAPAGALSQALALRWDGHVWTQAAVPRPGRASWLFGVDTVAPGNTWAVGRFTDHEGVHDLIAHYSSGTWHRVVGPNLGPGSGLLSVSGAAPNDLWAVGFTLHGQRTTAVMIHWNGSHWSAFHGPAPHSVDPYAVATIGPDDAWLVGATNVASDPEPYREHWNGHVWIKD